MSAARKFGPPASLVLSAVAFVLAVLGRRTPVDQEDLRRLEADAAFYASDADARARKLDGAERGAAALEEAAAALEKKLLGSEVERRESYMKAVRKMLAEIVPRACGKGWAEFMAATTPEVRDGYRFKGEALRVLRLDEKKAEEFAQILVQERREQRDARRKLGRDRKKLRARLGEIKRGVEQRLQALLSKEEHVRYESWRKAGN